MDESTCQAAIAAGIPVEHLKEMGVILQQKPKRLDDLPRGEIAKKEVGPLDETEDEEDEPELVPDGGESGKAVGVEKAIEQLTKIATRLTEPKKDWFESLVEGGSGSAASSGETGGPSSRRNAAAMRALQKSLVERPKQIFQSIEANLASDFMSRAVVPGEPFSAGATTRGWLTSRSRIQNYTNQVRWSWQVCGIWDCLIAGRHEEARARCAVLIAASDQSSIDGGSWLLASSALLEAPPPFQAFQNHSPPSLQELQHTVLLEPRWIEVLMAHLKEVDTFIESKKKLGGKPLTGGKTEKEKEEEAAQRARAKAKAKQERFEKARRQREHAGQDTSGTAG